MMLFLMALTYFSDLNLQSEVEITSTEISLVSLKSFIYFLNLKNTNEKVNTTKVRQQNLNESMTGDKK